MDPELRRAIEQELARYPEPRAASVEVLRLVQQQRRWVDDAHLAAVADMLGMDVAELEGVATFYNLIFRRPVGRHVILHCDSIVCWIMEGERLGAALQQRLGIGPGETTGDDRFTLLPGPCLGACHGAPALLIDGELHTDLTPERLDAVLARYP